PAGTLYVAGREGLSRSDDQGNSWTGINRGLESSNIRSLAIAPQDPKTLYLGTNGSGLYRSRDGGNSWKRMRGSRAARRTGQPGNATCTEKWSASSQTLHAGRPVPIPCTASLKRRSSCRSNGVKVVSVIAPPLWLVYLTAT